MSHEADAAKRLRRIERLLVVEGLSQPEITTKLMDEGLVTTKNRESAERLVRRCIAKVLDGLPPAKAAQASPLTLAKYVRRNETLLAKLMHEFEEREGVTVTEIEYPNGKKMRIERRADRGGMRIRAAELALKCADTIAKAEGVAALLERPAGMEDPGDAPKVDAPKLRIQAPNPARMTPEQRKQLARTLTSANRPDLAALYATDEDTPNGDDVAN